MVRDQFRDVGAGEPVMTDSRGTALHCLAEIVRENTASMGRSLSLLATVVAAPTLQGLAPRLEPLPGLRADLSTTA
jgi:hypothetical protein